jgi:hypothetical protein
MRYRLKLSPDGGTFTRDHLNKHKSYTESIRVKFLLNLWPTNSDKLIRRDTVLG